MTNYVLVAGAWLGGRAWDEVAEELRRGGHTVHPVTLSGLAEKSDVPAGQRTHVQDIVDAVEHAGPAGVVLVGHSYAGVPVGQAAARVGDRLAHVVFVDSEVPADGRAFVSSPWGGSVVAAIAENGGSWPPPPAQEFEGQDLTDAQIGRLLDGATPHPGAALTEPAELTRPLGELPATYVKCLLDGPEPNDDVVELLKSDRWRLVEMETGHWPMFSKPRELARILAEVPLPS
ncbi:alpha/beta hydrolase [Streptomyces sp. NBC_00247]|uniref:alpha/beta fold hydrolase n=1 Tax=Streptomyces sp. NBC_00247 TaxID=2975689 RepID=UPI002E2CE96E|nr:alpha/beta hydrolase [Streptomyces sp. NBC_00247]